MDFIARLWPPIRHLARTLFRRDQVEHELSQELDGYLDLLVEEKRRAGLSPQEARRAARLEFGGVDAVKDDCRQVWGVRHFDELGRDVRIGVRMLRKAPGFAAVAILTLALGIGATTAIFSVVNGVLLKPLPFEDQDDLVGVLNRNRETGAGAGFGLFPDQYFPYRGENRVFEDIGVFQYSDGFAVTGLAEPEVVGAMTVTAGLLPFLRVQPVIGRLFTEEDDSPGAPITVMLSYAYWQRQGADPSVVGRTLRLVGGPPAEIIGVLPPEFMLARGPGASIYVPVRWDRANPPRATVYSAIARLLPGATIEQAGTDLERMLPIWAEQTPAVTPAGVEEAQWVT